MQRRFLLSGLLAALALSAAACADETPTFAGEGQFPPGSIAVTREVILPASEFFRSLGSFSGYTRASDLASVVVANKFEGVLDAHALARFGPFSSTVAYRRDGVEKRDAAFSYTNSSLVLRVDTLASTEGPVTVQVWQAAQAWERTSATWTTAIDTGSVETRWTEPGGTRGTLLAEGTFAGNAAAGDTLVLRLTGAAVASLADTLSNGVVITTTTGGARLEVTDLVVRAGVRPDSAAPDTTVVQSITPSARTTVYTPEQPDPGPGILAVGGVRSARTLIEINPDRPLPACAVGETCGTIAFRDVQLNQVDLLLRPVPVPSGFGAITGVPLSLRVASEAELGAGAPLGPRVLDQSSVTGVRTYNAQPGDTLVAVPITGVSRTLAVADTLPRTFALISELQFFDSPPTFGVAFFDAQPRLRIIYTLPARRRLP
jgi:hypothetical protein